jgi:N-acetylglutamate synthase-like GNAT family acetyltransferase
MTPGAFEISTDAQRIDVDFVHGFLKTTYWAGSRSRETVERSIRNSLCFGVYRRDGCQVGFARVVSDHAVFAYLADVFVVSEVRGLGAGKLLIRTIVEHPDLQGLQVFLLRTRDAHGLYSQFGFTAAPRPEELMVRTGA